MGFIMLSILKGIIYSSTIFNKELASCLITLCRMNYGELY